MATKAAKNDNLLVLPSAEEAGEVAMTPLFELDGKVYSIPAEPRAGISLKYLKISTEQGQDPAAYYLLTEMLGQEVFDTLSEHPTLTQPQFEEIFARIENRVLGGGKN